MAGAHGSPQWEGLAVGQVCGAPSLAPQPYPGAGGGRGNARGLPTGKQAAASSAVPLGSPTPSIPNCAHPPCSAGVGLLCQSRGLRGQSCRLPEHTSWLALGFLTLKMSWPSCSLQTWQYPQLSRCLPGAVRDLWQPPATRSPVTRGPGSCPPEPRRAHKSLSPGHVLLQSRGQPLLGTSVSVQAGTGAPARRASAAGLARPSPSPRARGHQSNGESRAGQSRPLQRRGSPGRVCSRGRPMGNLSSPPFTTDGGRASSHGLWAGDMANPPAGQQGTGRDRGVGTPPTCWAGGSVGREEGALAGSHVQLLGCLLPLIKVLGCTPSSVFSGVRVHTPEPAC